jgi:hypothetical protein
VRDDAARLCDLAGEGAGGVRADMSVYPACAATHKMQLAGRSWADARWSGLVVESHLAYYGDETFVSLFGEASLALVDGQPPPW